MDPAGNEIPVVAMETVPTVHLTMDIDMDDGTMGMDMIGAVNCAAMAGAAANAHDAQDLTQDVYVQVWNCAEQYRPAGSPIGWLLTVCRNLCLMHLRREKKKAALSEEEWDAIPAQACSLDADERILLLYALAALGDEERRIVLLHAVTGMKHREIAALLELPLPTVLSKYHRALKKMRIIMEGDDAR